MTLLGDPALQAAIRIAIAAMFAAAAVHKLRDLASFTATVRNYRIGPAALSPLAAIALPKLELLIAVLLLVRPSTAFAPIGALALLALYSGAIAINLARGRRDIDCGCLGPGHRQPLSEWLLVRNATLAAAAACLLVPRSIRSLEWLDGIAIAGCSAALSILWVAANRLLETWPRVRFLGE